MQLRPVHAEEDYQNALDRIEEIHDAGRVQKEGNKLEIPGILVDEYEK